MSFLHDLRCQEGGDGFCNGFCTPRYLQPISVLQQREGGTLSSGAMSNTIYFGPYWICGIRENRQKVVILAILILWQGEQNELEEILKKFTRYFFTIEFGNHDATEIISSARVWIGEVIDALLLPVYKVNLCFLARLAE